MKLLNTKNLISIALMVLVLSIVLATISLYTVPDGNPSQTRILVADTFQLFPNETYRQGLGSFFGGENITLEVQSPEPFGKNFSLMAPVSNYGLLIKSNTTFSIFTQTNLTYSFIASPDYYDAVFSSASTVGKIYFQASETKQGLIYPYASLKQPSEILFLISLTAAILLTFRKALSHSPLRNQNKIVIPSLNKKDSRRLLILILIGLTVWLLVLVINSNPLSPLESWYTDNARDSYSASLFLKEGFQIFSTPLGKLSSLAVTNYRFVTWPQMPHLYPLGSVLLFLPFGELIQNGVNPTMLFKIEIAIFLVVASVCVYFFLKVFLKKELSLILKLLGVYLIYVALVAYAADGMFESVAFIFSLFAVYMFLTERYDYFFLLLAISIFFKYEPGIFLLPLVALSIIRLLEQNSLSDLLRNKAIIVGFIFGCVSIFTASMSAPYLVSAGPQLIMNGINAFSSNTHISWINQSFFVLLTLGATIAYAFYMLDKNSFLSLSALFLLLPSFLMPYFQNWYLPFIFVYALIPQQKKELDATVLWLIFMVAVLVFSGTNFQMLFQYLH